MKYLLFFIHTCFSLTLFSQSEKINWIFFIDNKVPNPNMLEGEFLYRNDSLEKSIKFEYMVGDIEVHNEDFRDLKSCDSLIIKLKYKEMVGNTLNFYNYSFQVPSRLLFKYDYVVLDIKNINKRKGYFYFDYSTNYEKTVRVKRRRKSTGNTSRSYIYSNERIMKEIEKEKRRVIIIEG